MGDAFNALARSLATGASAFKYPCRVVATSNITLSGTQTIDSVSVAAGDRVLCVDQTSAKQNGIYVCSSTTWARAEDLASGKDWQAILGLYVPVLSGTIHGRSIWQLTTPATGTIRLDVDSLTFTELMGGIDVSVNAGTVQLAASEDDFIVYAQENLTLTAENANLTLNAGGTIVLSNKTTLSSGLALSVVTLADNSVTLSAGTILQRVPAVTNARTYTLPSTAGLTDGHTIRVSRVGTEAFAITINDPTGPTTIATISSGAAGWVEAVKRSTSWRVSAWGGTVTGISTGV